MITMRTWIQLMEGLSASSVPWNWQSRNSGLWVAEFEINDIRYFVEIAGVYTISLSFRSIPGDWSLTGNGNAFRIVNTVFDITMDFMKQCHPPTIVFTAKKNQPSRIKLYSTLAQTIAEKHPEYSLDIDSDHAKEVYFTFSLTTD